MTITQLFLSTALIAGMLLYAALAIVPLILEHEARQADRPVTSARLPRLPQPQPQGGVVAQTAQPRLVHQDALAH